MDEKIIRRYKSLSKEQKEVLDAIRMANWDYATNKMLYDVSHFLQSIDVFADKKTIMKERLEEKLEIITLNQKKIYVKTLINNAIKAGLGDFVRPIYKEYFGNPLFLNEAKNIEYSNRTK